MKALDFLRLAVDADFGVRLSHAQAKEVQGDIARLDREREAARDNFLKARDERDQLWVFVHALAGQLCAVTRRADETCADRRLGERCSPCEARELLRLVGP